MMRRLIPLALALAIGTQAAAAEEVTSARGALIRGLDKMSGETLDVELRSGQAQTFGRLTFALSDCRYPVGDPASNAYAFLTVSDARSGNVEFKGWMVASSPALSALDDPRYDIWVLRCISD